MVRRQVLICLALWNSAAALPAFAQAGSTSAGPAHMGSIEPDGTVLVLPFRLPPSHYLSSEARDALPRSPTDPEAMMLRLPSEQVADLRARMPHIMADRLATLRQTFAVDTREGRIGGVAAVYATPSGGVARANRGRILLNIPGGGFVMGVASGTGMVESIPLASVLGVEIVSITYRQGPEHRFPAATDDIVSVYRELLRTHRPQNIAIFGCSAVRLFGCSAGGLLTAEAIARFQREDLPMPAAAGIFCSSADARWVGDSRVFSRPFQALPPRERMPVYFDDADLNDPAVSPILSRDILARLPPTLLITATRAHELSGAVSTHRALIRAGVPAELIVWDGLGHAFFYDASLPESREAFELMAAFFRRHLGMAGPPRSHARLGHAATP